MKLYNEETDTVVRGAKKLYRKGQNAGYVAINDETGERLFIDPSDIHEWQDTRLVDVEYLRGNDIGGMDDFMYNVFS